MAGTAGRGTPHPGGCRSHRGLPRQDRFVSLTLTSADVERLQAALTTLLSPLQYEQLDEWRTAARKAIEPLVGADKSTFVLPLEGEPLIQCDAADQAAYTAYMEYYIQLDTGFHVTRRERNLEVSHAAMVYDYATISRSELYNDWACRYGMLTPLAMAIDVTASPYPATLSFHCQTERPPDSLSPKMAVLHLLLPAFKAGVFTCCQVAGQRATFVGLIDQLPGGIAAYDGSGRLVHQNPALTRLLMSEPQAALVRTELERTASLVGAVGTRSKLKSRARSLSEPVQRRIRTARSQYIIRGSYVGHDLLPRPAVVIVFLEDTSAESLTSAELATQYGLTARELQVAGLLAQGRSSAQVARELSFTVHTARRHTEHVLLKLGLHSRAEVGAKLRARPP
jgi:DNA-binding CsgD family transcriptional regulator